MLEPILPISELKILSKKARVAILTMTTKAKSGHPGGSMSSIDLLLALYHSIKVDPLNPKMIDRDMVVVSHGHISPAVYSALALRGYFPIEEAISQFRVASSRYEGHIEPSVPGVEWATGNLGQGLSAACGFALASKNNQIYCLMGDGEQQKGQISEARKFAIKYNLNNITAIVDYNRLQICGKLSDVMPQNIKANYESDGWAVLTINGHDFKEIFDALKKAKKINSPVMILAKTVMGNGVSFMENKEKFHGAALSEAELKMALDELGHDSSFSIPAPSLGNVFENKKHIHDFPTVLGTKLYHQSTDNRTAWGDALLDIAKANEHTMINVFDCDLTGSVKTLDFSKLRPKNFYQCGIMEHHTAVCAGALSKTYPSTFFAAFGMFGLTEVYNQHRLNDINKTNLKVILTHVGLDVGEDGKTHQCIDYIGLLNNMFNFKIIVPADANQTYKAIQFISNQPGNWLVAMGRSKLDIIKTLQGEIYYNEHYKFNYGKADVLRHGNSATMFVCGTLVNTAIKVVDELSKRGCEITLINVATPFDIEDEIVYNAVKTGMIYTLEDHNVKTGLGALLSIKMVELGVMCPVKKFGVNNYAVSGSAEDVYKWAGLDEMSLIDEM